MKFRTEIEVPELTDKLNYSTKALFIGSCFTTNIGEYMQKHKFQADVNPFGVLYNPASIVNSLELLLDAKVFDASELHNQNGLWFSYTHHSSFSAPDKNECLKQISSRMQQSSAFFQQCNFLFITLGSAYTYKLKQSGKIVANCHKTPANEFDRILLSPDMIVNSFSNLFDKLFTFKPKLKIIFSVSPVRHLKDGAHGNQISKACLLLSIEELRSRYAENCFYFPAYELLLDDLRDYRFYADDMCHPSNQAIAYIWNKFQQYVINENCNNVMDKIEDITSACAHRPFNANSSQHKVFQDKTIGKIKELLKTYPFMDFKKELESLSPTSF